MTPAQRETLTIFSDCMDDELAGSETRGFAWALVSVDRERYHALRAALAAPPKTCGTCRRWEDLQHLSGPRVGLCLSDHRVNDDVDRLMAYDDGCIKGYTPKEADRG